jgi:hypothetical protein
MSAPPLSKIIRFLLIAAGLIIILSVAWNFIDEGYTTFLGNIASKLVPADYKVEQREGTLYFTRQYFVVDVGGKPTQVSVPANYPPDYYLVASAIQFGLLLAIALVAATPGITWTRRILYSMVTALVTFTLQVLSIVIMGLTFNSVLFLIVSDLFPPLLWAIFSFRYWLFPNKSVAVRHPGPQNDNLKKRSR